MNPRLPRSHAPLWCLLLLLVACQKNSNQLAIKYTNFKEAEVAHQQNLVFTLNKDVYPDSLLQRWDSTAFVEFTPKISGRFKWNSAHELLFSPSVGFAPGTHYTATLTKRALHYSKRQWPVDQGKLSFHTAPLRVVQSRISWTRGKSMANVLVQLDLDFNYDVNIQEAASHLQLTAGGRKLMANTINAGAGKTVSLQFMPPANQDAEVALKIALSKGVRVQRSSYVSQGDTSFQTMIPSRYNLEVTEVSAQHSGLDGTIIVHTSQPLVEQNLTQMVSIEPQVPFEVTPDESGFVLASAALKADQTYNLTISDKIEGQFGGKMKAKYETQVAFGQLQPSVTFANSKGMYLSSRGYRNVALNVVAVPELELSVIKVYENNIEQLFSRSMDYGYEYDELTSEFNTFNYFNTFELGDTVFHKVYRTDQLPKKNAARILNLDFQDKIKGYDGVYVITVASKEHRWVQDSKILSLSDIGLIVKEDRDNIYVFANSIRQATPLDGVKVSFISTNNQLMHTEITDATGVARFADVRQKAPGFRTGLVTARRSGEFSFIALQRSAVETSRFDVDGRMPNDAGLNAMLYAERDLYRPGETINASAIVRDEQWKLPGEMPVKLRLVMPNGREFATRRKILNEQGAAEVSFQIPPTAVTGTYNLELLSGADVLLQQYAISIEEFLPDRIKPTLKIDRQQYAIGDTIHVSLQADNLFGTPAAGRNYELQLNMTKENFESKAFPDYVFRLQNEFNFATEIRSGQTSATGSVRQTFTVGNDVAHAGLLKGNVMASVFDENGRPVHRFENFRVYTQPVFLGLRLPDSYVGTRTPMKIGLIAVNQSGALAPSTAADVVIVRKEWHTVIQQEGTHFRYVSQKDEKLVRKTRVATQGADFNTYFTPDVSGEYEIRLSLPGSNSYVSETFYAWGAADTRYTSFDVDNEGNVAIKLNQERYNVGDDMDILFTTPFDGKLLVTLERDKVLRHLYLTTQNKSASLRLKAEDLMAPNVYVSATLFRPMDGADIPLTVAHGFKSIPVEHHADVLPVAVSMAGSSRSKTKQIITVKTSPGASVTIAAVDEGILQVKNYQSPDPYKYFYQKVALATRSYDIYPFLLPEIKWNASSTGGDAAAASQMRVNPMFVNRVKNVSYWSGMLTADAKGEVRLPVDIPQFSGDLRVMVVAYKGRQFGAAEKHMKVADPIVISTGLPRFLSPRDEATMPVTLSNTTNRPLTCSVQAQATALLQVSGGASTVTIPANREQRLIFTVRAGQAIGAANLRVTVRAGSETYTDETDISIRPPASLQHQTANGILPGGKQVALHFPGNFIPGTENGALVVGRSPLISLGRQLSDLVQYPYGCVEQTVSAAFPQLYYGDLTKVMTGLTSSDENPAYNVQQAILKLQAMQLSNGSLSYWPESGSESWWGSAYAAHFMLEAQRAGFDVNTRTLERLLQYLRFRLNKRETEILYYNENLKREIVSKTAVYSVYVLAMANRPQQNLMNYYKAHPDMLALDSRYLLAATFARAGQGAQARAVLPPAFAGEQSSKSSTGSLYSHTRDLGMALYALYDMDPANAQVAMLARTLSQSLQNARYLNTQESVWGILAMGKLARSAAQSTVTGVVSFQGKNIATLTNASISVNLRPYWSAPMSIQASGKGNLYYFWTASGITADGSYKQEDNYLKVRRSYLSRSGAAINGATFGQNDLIVVRLSIEGQFATPVDQVVVTDLLPAGLEIENARLVDMPGMTWIKNQATPDYMDVRDDRIHLFTSVSNQRKDFYYLARAVTPGVYQAGPVQAEAMYNGAFHSYHGAGVVTIKAQ